MDYHKKKRTRSERNKLQPVINNVTKLRLGLFNQGKQSKTITREASAVESQHLDDHSNIWHNSVNVPATSTKSKDAISSIQNVAENRTQFVADGPSRKSSTASTEASPSMRTMKQAISYLTSAIDTKLLYPTAPDYFEMAKKRLSDLYSKSSQPSVVHSATSVTKPQSLADSVKLFGGLCSETVQRHRKSVVITLDDNTDNESLPNNVLIPRSRRSQSADDTHFAVTSHDQFVTKRPTDNHCPREQYAEKHESSKTSRSWLCKEKENMSWCDVDNGPYNAKTSSTYYVDNGKLLGPGRDQCKAKLPSPVRRDQCKAKLPSPGERDQCKAKLPSPVRSDQFKAKLPSPFRSDQCKAKLPSPVRRDQFKAKLPSPVRRDQCKAKLPSPVRRDQFKAKLPSPVRRDHCKSTFQGPHIVSDQCNWNWLKDDITVSSDQRYASCTRQTGGEQQSLRRLAETSDAKVSVARYNPVMQPLLPDRLPDLSFGLDTEDNSGQYKGTRMCTRKDSTGQGQETNMGRMSSEPSSSIFNSAFTWINPQLPVIPDDVLSDGRRLIAFNEEQMKKLSSAKKTTPRCRQVEVSEWMDHSGVSRYLEQPVGSRDQMSTVHAVGPRDQMSTVYEHQYGYSRDRDILDSIDESQSFNEFGVDVTALHSDSAYQTTTGHGTRRWNEYLPWQAPGRLVSATDSDGSPTPMWNFMSSVPPFLARPVLNESPELKYYRRRAF